MIGRRWFRRRWVAATFALVYLMHPHIQGYCLHDLHANVLAIPTMLIAAGLMEAGYVRWALVAATVTALCREETALFSGCLGLYWLVSARSRTRLLAGLATCVISGVVLVAITLWLMPRSGGQPRWSHFSMFFSSAGSMKSVIEAYLLNPLGVVVAAGAPLRAEFAWLSFLPFGFLAVFGRRGAWFALVAVVLIVGSANSNFFFGGMNYSAPIMPAVVMMSLFGARAWAARGPRGPARLRRLATLCAYALGVAGVSNYLYGNILSKSYKLEWGSSPVRRENESNYADHMGYMRELPAYGERERKIWEAIARVPPDVPISTSWQLNPQLSSRGVAQFYPYLGDGHPKDNLSQYVILDKLPPEIESPEAQIDTLRHNPAWEVNYENEYAIIFKRR
jgi:hypothetical protein